MTEIQITNSSDAGDAVCWCMDNLARDDWNVKIACMVRGWWTFSFANCQAATFVKLKFS
jgi:hypothetical protein